MKAVRVFWKDAQGHEWNGLCLEEDGTTDKIIKANGKILKTESVIL